MHFPEGRPPSPGARSPSQAPSVTLEDAGHLMSDINHPTPILWHLHRRLIFSQDTFPYSSTSTRHPCCCSCSHHVES